MNEPAETHRTLSPLALGGRFVGAVVVALAVGLITTVVAALIALAVGDSAPASTDSDGLNELVAAVQTGLAIGAVTTVVAFIAIAALFTRQRASS